MSHRSFAAALVSSLLVLALAGCGMKVTPPLAPADPVTVYIGHHGIHTSLLLPREPGRYAQYSFSQWGWAAMDRDEWFRAPFALLLPGRGTLGTRDLCEVFTSDDLCCCTALTDCHPPMDSVYQITVSSLACRQTLAALDARWAAGNASSAGSPSNDSSHECAVANAKRQLYFVPDAASYSLGHNCNTEVAQWLRDLGCTVSGPAVTSDISVLDSATGKVVATARRPASPRLSSLQAAADVP